MNIFTKELLEKMQGKNKSFSICFIILLSSVLVLSSCESIGLYFDGKKQTANTEEVALYIPTGTDLPELKKLLVKNGIIEDEEEIDRLANRKKLAEGRIAAGKYSIPKHFNINEMLNGFTLNSLGNGNREVTVKVTFNNCRGIAELAGKVAQHIEADSADIAGLILSRQTLEKYGFKEATIPAMFLPDTYEMYWDTSAEDFLQRMAHEFKKFWTDERKQRIAMVGLNSQSEVVTLASIVYKEQDRHPEEWPTIARLYLNRIQQGWKLQSDPTFVFCWGDELKNVQRLLAVHREIDCPYNTYKIVGLPPGPIYIPPAKVIDAVLYPDENNYLFMCAKPDGNGLHNFAKNLTEHNRNAKAYQQWLSKNKIR